MANEYDPLRKAQEEAKREALAASAQVAPEKTPSVLGASTQGLFGELTGSAASLKDRTEAAKCQLARIIDRLEGPRPQAVAVGAAGPEPAPEGFLHRTKSLQDEAHDNMSSIEDSLGRIEAMLSGDF